MLVLVTNRAMAGAEFLERVEECVAGGVTHVILREKDLMLEDLVILGNQVKKRIEPWGAKLFINSRFEIAASAAERVGADGIHLTFADFSRFRDTIKWKNMKAGVSVHSIEEVDEIIENSQMAEEIETAKIVETAKISEVVGVGEDVEISESGWNACMARILPEYILVGHIFETQCKVGLVGRGTVFLGEVCRAAMPIPVIAIGGISLENIAVVKAAGAAGVAVMGLFMNGEETGKLAKELRRKLINHMTNSTLASVTQNH